MSNDSTASGLMQTWVPVTDNQGRTYLEAHWVDPASSPAIHATHAA
jgi:hypothetical protein